MILSRFILSLRSIYYSSSSSTNSEHNSSRQHSTVYFASVIEGNLGATLTTSWGGDGETDVDEDRENIRYSEYPFETGLSDIKEEEGSVVQGWFDYMRNNSHSIRGERLILNCIEICTMDVMLVLLSWLSIRHFVKLNKCYTFIFIFLLVKHKVWWRDIQGLQPKATDTSTDRHQMIEVQQRLEF